MNLLLPWLVLTHSSHCLYDACVCANRSVQPLPRLSASLQNQYFVLFLYSVSFKQTMQKSFLKYVATEVFHTILHRKKFTALCIFSFLIITVLCLEPLIFSFTRKFTFEKYRNFTTGFIRFIMVEWGTLCWYVTGCYFEMFSFSWEYVPVGKAQCWEHQLRVQCVGYEAQSVCGVVGCSHAEGCGSAVWPDV